MIKACVRGQLSDALRITELPQASGTAIALTPRMMGAFQGAMPTITPTGSRSAMATVPWWSDGITSPWIWVVIAAASRIMPAARARLNMRPACGRTDLAHHRSDEFVFFRLERCGSLRQHRPAGIRPELGPLDEARVRRCRDRGNVGCLHGGGA